MCIIAEYVESVTETNIFVGRLENDHQLTIYSNKVKTLGDNTMVLPVPTNFSVEFVDLTNYKDLFKNLHNTFKPRNRGGLESYSKNTMLGIKVEKVGSYVASFAKDINSIKNLDKMFGSFDKIMASLQKYYGPGSGFGFVVCKLIPGPEHEYHPFGYIHKMTNKELFVPTRHIHIHNNFIANFTNQTDAKTEKYDHNIYSVDTNTKRFYHNTSNAITGTSEWVFNDSYNNSFNNTPFFKEDDDYKIINKLESMLGKHRFPMSSRKLSKLSIKDYYKNDDILVSA